MEEVSISQVDIQANTLEENDLLLISQYKQDGSFDSAKIEGRNLKQKMPGLMVRLWNCHDAQLELPFDGRDVINNLTYTDDSFVWYNSRSGTKEEVICEAASEPLATDGCSILYKRLDSNNRYFHDQYNNSDFWYYAGSYDTPAIYKWTFTKYRTVDGETHLHTYIIQANELKNATIYDLVVYVDEEKVTQISDFQKLSDPDRFSFTLTIESQEDDALTTKKTVTTYDDVNFEDFVKSSEPVTPASVVDKGDMPDEKVMLFQGRIKLNKGQTVYFKGNADDYASIFVNNICLCDFVKYNQEEIDVSFTAPDDRKYYDFKLIIVNRGGPGPGFENDYEKYNDLMMKVDGIHDDYVMMTNQIFDANNQFFFLPANCDEYYRKAQNLRDHGAIHKAGVLIKMWHTGYEVGRLSASCTFDHNIINECSSDDYLIKNAVTINGRKYDLSAYENLNVSDGCEMLYSTVKNKYDPYFFDWFNGKSWNYYSGSSEAISKDYQYDSNPLDKKVLVYFGDIYLPKGQTVYFAGKIDDCVSVLVDGNYPITQDTDKIPLIGVHATDWDKNWKTYAYTSEYTGYHSLKIIACNCYEDGGPADTNITGGKKTFVLQISFNNKDWYHISNEGLGRNALFIPEGDKYDEIYKIAELTRDNIKRTRLPGMLVRMWEANVPAGEGKNHCNINRINYTQPEANKIDYGITVNGTNYDLNACYDLNVTQGCGILYKVENNSDKNYYDPYNAIKWDFSSISGFSTETHKEKVLAYYTELFLHAGQTVCFKGIPDDTVSIIFDDNDFPVDSEGNKLCYICCIEPIDNANKADPQVTYRYTAKETRYYAMRIIVSSKGGPGGFDDVNQSINSGLMISFDGAVTWKLITNEDFESPIFFIPEAERYTKIWYDAERARNTNNHYIDFEDPSPVTKTYSAITDNSQIWKANDNGTLFVCVACHTPAQSTYPTLWAAMPQSDNWVEIAKFGPHHGGGMTTSYQNVNVEIPLRVARGTRVKLTNIDSIQYDNVKLFRDLNFNYFSTYNVPNGYLVTFLNGYGGIVATRNNVPQNTTIAIIKPSNPTRNSDAQYSYTFNGWDKTDTYTIIDDTNVTAKWIATARTYNVQFVNNAGTVLKSYNSVKYGTDISSTMPTTAIAEEQESGYTYLFIGWDKTVNTVVKGNATYTAKYNKIETPNTYTVTFINGYGGVITTLTDVIENTKISDIKPTNPTRNDDERYSYSFNGWDTSDSTLVTKSMLVTANWTQTDKLYTIVFKNNGGTTISSKSYKYADTVIVPSDPTYENPETGKTYKFSGWTPSVAAVTDNKTYTATYNDDTTYTVKCYEDSTLSKLIWETTVKPNTTFGSCKPSSNPTKASTEQYNWEFRDYQNNATGSYILDSYKITSNLIVSAVWARYTNQYTLRFLNNDNSVLESKKVDYGTVPSYTGSTPTYVNPEAGKTYTFTGWSPAIIKVIKDSDYIAVYNNTINTYTVTFVDGFGNTVSTVNDVAYGTKVSDIKPANKPTHERDAEFNYTWWGWDKSDNSLITSNTIITAQWIKSHRFYAIRFLNNDGSYLTESDGSRFQVLEYGSTPSYTGSTPTYVNPEAGKTYTFTGWSPTIAKVTGDANYAAVYNEEYVDCTVTFKHTDGTTLATTTVKYGTTIGTAKSCVTTTPTRSDYIFNGWDKADSYIVVGATTVTTTWRDAVTYVHAYFYQNSCSPTPFKTVTLVKGSKLTSSQIPSSDDNGYTGWTRTWDNDTSAAINSDTSFTGSYSANIDFSKNNVALDHSWTQIFKNTSLQLPEGLTLLASVSGKAYHGANPTSHLIYLRLRSNKTTDIGQWSDTAIDGSSQNWVTYNLGACGEYEINGDTYLMLQWYKGAKCVSSVKWSISGTVSLTMY